MVTDRTCSISPISPQVAGAIRWMSPELLNPYQFGSKEIRPTEESDCYALGMVIYEVLSGQVPFPQDRISVVFLKVIKGERPTRPRGPGFTDDLWEMLELCWKHQPHDRPTLKTLLQRLEGVTQALRSPAATSQDMVTGTDNLLDRTVTNPGMVSTSLAASNVKQLQTGGFNPDKLPLPHLGRMVIPSTPHTDRAFSLSTSAAPPSLYDPLDREEMDETEGKNLPKDDKMIKAKPAGLLPAVLGFTKRFFKRHARTSPNTSTSPSTSR